MSSVCIFDYCISKYISVTSENFKVKYRNIAYLPTTFLLLARKCIKNMLPVIWPDIFHLISWWTKNIGLTQ